MSDLFPLTIAVQPIRYGTYWLMPKKPVEFTINKIPDTLIPDGDSIYYVEDNPFYLDCSLVSLDEVIEVIHEDIMWSWEENVEGDTRWLSTEGWEQRELLMKSFELVPIDEV